MLRKPGDTAISKEARDLDWLTGNGTAGWS